MRESYVMPAAVEDIAATDWTFDPLLPTQLVPVRKLDTMEPETRLALAVLEDAVMTLRAVVGVHTPRARKLAAEARAWLVSDDTTYPFAFVSVCEHLGLDAAWLRAGVLLSCRLRPQDVRRRVVRLRRNAERDRVITSPWRHTANDG